jgi:hypothetical protein
MIRSFAHLPARARSFLTAFTVRASSPGALSQTQSLRAAFASQSSQQPRSRAPPSPQQQQPRGAGQIVPPPGAAAPPPLPPVVEVTPESAEAIFSSSRFCSSTKRKPSRSPVFLFDPSAFAHACSQYHPHHFRFLRFLVRTVQDTHSGTARSHCRRGLLRCRHGSCVCLTAEPFLFRFLLAAFGEACSRAQRRSQTSQGQHRRAAAARRAVRGQTVAHRARAARQVRT